MVSHVFVSALVLCQIRCNPLFHSDINYNIIAHPLINRFSNGLGPNKTQQQQTGPKTSPAQALPGQAQAQAQAQETHAVRQPCRTPSRSPPYSAIRLPTTNKWASKSVQPSRRHQQIEPHPHQICEKKTPDPSNKMTDQVTPLLSIIHQSKP